MKEYFVVTDVHGFYSILIKALSDAGFEEDNPNHILISCGDLLDRGPEPLQCLKFVNKLFANNRAILIRGNHEDLMDDMIERGFQLAHDKHNGTIETARILTNHSERDINWMWESIGDMVIQEDYNFYRATLVNGYELNDYIFVHGWIPDKTPNWKQARWCNGMEEWHKGNIIENKTIVCGHWHTSFGHYYYGNAKDEWGPDADFSPFIEKGIIALDACTAYSKQVNVFKFEVEE